MQHSMLLGFGYESHLTHPQHPHHQQRQLLQRYKKRMHMLLHLVLPLSLHRPQLHLHQRSKQTGYNSRPRPAYHTISILRMVVSQCGCCQKELRPRSWIWQQAWLQVQHQPAARSLPKGCLWSNLKHRSNPKHQEQSWLRQQRHQ